MSEFDFMCGLLKLRVTKVVRFACHYLEDHGLRFCVDFGTENAVEKAREIALREIEDERRASR